jgi:leucyl aminopeptidase
VTPRSLDCLAPAATGRIIHAVRPGGLAEFLAGQPDHRAAFIRASGFTAAAGERPLLLPASDGPGSEGFDALLGIGDDRSHLTFGDLARSLPQGDWALAPGDYNASSAVLGFCLGAYAYTAFRAPPRPPARLVLPQGTDEAAALARTIWFVRDLINTPANALGPEELADAAGTIGAAYGAEVEILRGAQIETGYPALATVGMSAARPPCVAILRWRGTGATDRSPLVSLCGKGVVFDTGGLDLKPSAAMLRMKKDMGGAAILLGVAATLMRRDAPIRLALRLGCVENAVSSRAMRPGDILQSRAGLTIEVGNTDAEGRLVLADLLADASSEQPSVLIDCATLTGAARVATGPDLPALFCNDEAWATPLLAAGAALDDPLWRLPLWDGYDSWLASPVADLNNVSNKPFAGAIVAGLFLRRFVGAGIPWAHIDAYAWNDSARPGRPEGGEAQALRAIAAAIEAKFAVPNGLAT